MTTKKPTLDAELEKLQRESFEYFLHEANHANGLIRDKSKEDWPASIAATGVALTAYPIAVERGFMSRNAAIERTLNTLRFFWNSHQGTEPNATGYKGFYYHFLDMQTGQRAWRCELSTVDSAFLFAGMLTAGIYFNGNSKEEQEIRRLVDALYQRADWQWAQNQGVTVTHGWKPETGFLPYRWEGYDEAMLLYVLGLGSPTFPLPETSYTAWSKTYEWKQCYGFDYLYAGSLFTHQLSHVWLDFRHIQDAFMREKASDYFENSRRATYVQQRYAINNPLDFVGYGDCAFGITASDGPGFVTCKIHGIQRQFYDYIARGVPYGPDDGTLAPWAAITSLPFAPEIVLPVIDHYIYELKLKEQYRYGFRSTFNRTFPEKSHFCGWISPWHYGINQGPIVLMTENYRTELLWNLMRSCPVIINGLKRAGFSGGWLGTE
ncbi:MAG TPA: glucoamylase family protein [Gammaproteobacteria bacterium]|nr:glucoamylase family protein [Gammaproteobacteria bacterium]